MPASEHLEPRLFHGTGHYFKEGERITPRSTVVTSPVLRGQMVTFATSDLERAKARAGLRAAQMGTLFAPVYEVEADDSISHSTLSSPTDSVSKTGHIVKKLVDWGVNK